MIMSDGCRWLPASCHARARMAELATPQGSTTLLSHPMPADRPTAEPLCKLAMMTTRFVFKCLNLGDQMESTLDEGCRWQSYDVLQLRPVGQRRLVSSVKTQALADIQVL